MSSSNKVQTTPWKFRWILEDSRLINSLFLQQRKNRFQGNHSNTSSWLLNVWQSKCQSRSDIRFTDLLRWSGNVPNQVYTSTHHCHERHCTFNHIWHTSTTSHANYTRRVHNILENERYCLQIQIEKALKQKTVRSISLLLRSLSCYKRSHILWFLWRHCHNGQQLRIN